jgi:hypothetical protein
MGEDQALQRLQAVLARSEFQVDEPHPWWEQLLQPVLDLVGYVIARFIQAVVSTGSGSDGWWSGLVLLGCVALIVGVVVYLVRAIRLSVTHETRVGIANLSERRERSERLWQTAQQLAASGQWAEAVRLLYLSALYALDERALLHVETSLTNREHARELRRTHPEAAQTFSDIVDSYDRLRYGAYPVSESTFAELSGLVARARAASLGGSPA